MISEPEAGRLAIADIHVNATGKLAWEVTSTDLTVWECLAFRFVLRVDRDDSDGEGAWLSWIDVEDSATETSLCCSWPYEHDSLEEAKLASSERVSKIMLHVIGELDEETRQGFAEEGSS